jgi:hypothetical protein
MRAEVRSPVHAGSSNTLIFFDWHMCPSLLNLWLLCESQINSSLLKVLIRAGHLFKIFIRVVV